MTFVSKFKFKLLKLDILNSQRGTCTNHKCVYDSPRFHADQIVDYTFPACGNKEVLTGLSYFLIKHSY